MPSDIPHFEKATESLEAIVEEAVDTAFKTAPVATAISDAAWSAAVGAWLTNYVRSSAISQSPGAWNRLNDVLPNLRTLLEAELKK